MYYKQFLQLFCISVKHYLLHTLQVSENKALKKAFSPKRHEAKGQFKIGHYSYTTRKFVIYTCYLD